MTLTFLDAGTRSLSSPVELPVETSLSDLLRQVSRPLLLIDSGGQRKIVDTTKLTAADAPRPVDICGILPASPPQAYGCSSFCRDHGLSYAYVGGSMAKGISSTAMVKAFGEAGMLGFFGSAGLSFDEVKAAIAELQRHRPRIPFGVNLIHSPSEPELEKALVDLYLRCGVHLIEASAFLGLTLPLVRYRTSGIYRDTEGRIVTPNHIVAKVSREEVAARFFAPPPEKFLRQLVAAGELTEEQALLAEHIPMAQDVTAEADSGGHTDNRPALSLFPTLLTQKYQIQQQYSYAQPLRVGLGGGIATPASAVAAFAMGADYLVTGTVNQACIESGTCDAVRHMLAETRQADITMAPSGDMFEMGVKVQVVKRGTMFAIRAHKLYELYRAYDSLEALPAAERQKIEQTFFKTTFEDVWEQTQSYFQIRDPRQVEKALKDPKYKMALVFRWYLGQTPVWANQGIVDRKIDYQIWCGPAMGAFNEWVKGSFMEAPSARHVVTVAYNILFGAAVLHRARLLAQQWRDIPVDPNIDAPLPMHKIKEYLR